MKPLKKCILMMADDDPDDREFVREAFEQCGFEGEFRYVEDGAELLDYLLLQGEFSGGSECPAPDLILLDLNMPRVNGHEALTLIKSNSKLRRIPIVALSTSESADDIEKTYDLGVNSFITKPSSFDQLVELADGLKRYWLEMVKLPTTV
ncbi:MAG: response regulator [Verrucomicrobiales bacterium]|nr:response regulator [bacterium]MDF2375784.1 response regulator [Verrucomicrobiales bacterium]